MTRRIVLAALAATIVAALAGLADDPARTVTPGGTTHTTQEVP